jgi:hypothetical protein
MPNTSPISVSKIGQAVGAAIAIIGGSFKPLIPKKK